MKEQHIRVGIYARVSTDNKGQSNENQLVDLREFIQRKSNEGWYKGKEYIDEASGKSGDRDKFKIMMDDASRKEFDLLLFWSLDRFSREGTLPTLQYLQKLTSYGVEWYSYREEYLRSLGPFRDMILSVLASIAQQERIRLTERVTAGLRRVAKTGTKSGKPIGRPKVIVDRVRLREMKESGMSVMEIATKLGLKYRTVYRGLGLEKPKPIRLGIE